MARHYERSYPHLDHLWNTRLHRAGTGHGFGHAGITGCGHLQSGRHPVRSAGRPPFLGSHALSIIRQATDISAPKLRSLSKVADRDLETICARCLEREPSARYPSAGNFAEDLERWLKGRPIVARPVSTPVRLW